MLRGHPLNLLRSTLIGAFVLAVVHSTRAASDQTLEQFDAASQFDRALAAVDAIKARKRLQCILSTANRPLCQCLSQRLPVDTYPRSYPGIARQEAEYDAMSAAAQTVVRQCISGGP